MSKEQFVFRSATNNDIPQIVDLVRQSLSELNLSYSPDTSESDLHDIEANYTCNGGAFEVIENGQARIIGTIALLKMDPLTAKLRKMYVDKEYRNLGFAKQLTGRIIERAMELGFKEIVLETVHTMAAAIHLYESYGFRKLEGHIASSPRCDIIMKKSLI